MRLASRPPPLKSRQLPRGNTPPRYNGGCRRRSAADELSSGSEPSKLSKKQPSNRFGQWPYCGAVRVKLAHVATKALTLARF